MMLFRRLFVDTKSKRCNNQLVEEGLGRTSMLIRKTRGEERKAELMGQSVDPNCQNRQPLDQAPVFEFAVASTAENKISANSNSSHVHFRSANAAVRRMMAKIVK